MEEQNKVWNEWFTEREAVSAEIDAEVAAILAGEDVFAPECPIAREFRDRPVAADMLAIGERARANQ